MAKPENKGRNVAKRCGSHGLAVAITSKKTKLHTHKLTSPCLLHDAHHSWWNPIKAVKMPWVAEWLAASVYKEAEPGTCRPGTHHPTHPTMVIVL